LHERDKGYSFRGDKLRYYRIRRLISQENLANKAGMSVGQVSRIESGRITAPTSPQSVSSRRP
jgi:transcriptional regulator with XRE-family HTH domain